MGHRGPCHGASRYRNHQRLTGREDQQGQIQGRAYYRVPIGRMADTGRLFRLVPLPRALRILNGRGQEPRRRAHRGR